MYFCPCKNREDEQATGHSDKIAKPATAFSPIWKTRGNISLAGGYAIGKPYHRTFCREKQSEAAMLARGYKSVYGVLQSNNS